MSTISLVFASILAVFGAFALAFGLVGRRRAQEQAFVKWQQTNPAAHANGVPPADWRVFACEWSALFGAVALGLAGLEIARLFLEQVRVL